MKTNIAVGFLAAGIGITTIGCGGGGQGGGVGSLGSGLLTSGTSGTTAGTTTNSPKGLGTLSFSIKWPKYVAPHPAGIHSHIIPASTMSISVVVNDVNGAQLQTALLNRTTNTQDLVSITNVPSGPVSVIIVAYDGTGGSGNAVAGGTVNPTVLAGQTVTTTLTLDAIGITSVKVVPFPATVSVGQQITLVATAYDANGAVVLNDPTSWVWSNDATQPVNLTYAANSNTATVTGVAPGPYIISVGTVTGDATNSVVGTQVTVTVANPVVNTAVYHITNLGSIGGVRMQPSGINKDGVVVGYDTRSDGTHHGFVWLGDAPNSVTGHIRDIGSLGGTNTQAYRIDDTYQLVGQSDLAGGGFHAFSSTPNGTLNDLGTFLGGGSSEANGTSNNGYVVGAAATATGHTHAAFFSLGEVIDLGVPQGATDSVARNVNSNGIVSGFYVTSANQTRAFRYDSSTGPGTQIASTDDIGTLGGAGAAANGLNELGQVVGASDTSNGGHHAFLWTQGATNGVSGNPQMLDLGALGTINGGNSNATAVNEMASTGPSLEVVGLSLIDNGPYHAFIWQNGTMADLNNEIGPNSGWVLTEADGVNDKGQITGYGTCNGVQCGYLLTPLSGSQPTIAKKRR